MLLVSVINVCSLRHLLLFGAFKCYVTQGGGGGLLIFLTNCEKGAVGYFWHVMSYFLNNSRFSISGLKKADLALFKSKFDSTSKSRLAIIFDAILALFTFHFHHFQ